VPLPVKQESNMLKRGQDDDAKYLCELNIVMILVFDEGFLCMIILLQFDLNSPLFSFKLWNFYIPNTV
jgi:hypothetical protein